MSDLVKINRYLEFSSTVTNKTTTRIGELPCITISRMAGCRGNKIAEMLAEKLNQNKNKIPWQVYNKNLINKILEKNNWPEGFQKYLNDHQGFAVKYAIEETLGLHPSMDMMQKLSRETIRDLAKMGNVILVGRGSNFILAKNPGVIHIRILGSLPYRIKQIQGSLSFQKKDAEDYLKKQDSEREKFIRNWFKKNINDPFNYDCVINTDKISNTQAVNMIYQLI